MPVQARPPARLLGALCGCALALGLLQGCGAPLAAPAEVGLAKTPAAAAQAGEAPTAVPTAAPTAVPTPTPSPTPTPRPEVFVGAGDIATCDSDGDEQTARLLDAIPGTVFTLGDNAYGDGTLEQFQQCYDPTWGRHKARTRPAPGNHDYHTAQATGYYAYFGERAGPAGQGYYSFDLGAWHIVALNSEIKAGPNSAQAQWLRADLAANPSVCTLAYWHEPLFSSGPHGNDAHMQPIWDILAGAGADVVLAGHDHDYERFAPQTSSGEPDPNGMREFVVGTGGASHYAFEHIRPNSEARNNDTFGVLKLTLRATSYDWQFIPVAGGAFHDSGSAACVGAPAGGA
jgi:hypothetical protein